MYPAAAPDTGPRGATFVVSGAKFVPSTLVTITLDGGFNRTVTSNSSGGFSFNLTPAGTLAKGTHTVAARGGDGQTAIQRDVDHTCAVETVAGDGKRAPGLP